MASKTEELVMIVGQDSNMVDMVRNDGTKTKGIYVDIVYNISKITDEQIAEQPQISARCMNPHLYTGTTVDSNGTKHYDNKVCVTAEQYYIMRNTAKKNAYHSNKGYLYYPFKSEVAWQYKPKLSPDGKLVFDSDGKPVKEKAGLMPFFKSVKPSDYGAFTKADYYAQYKNMTKGKNEYAAQSKAKKTLAASPNKNAVSAAKQQPKSVDISSVKIDSKKPASWDAGDGRYNVIVKERNECRREYSYRSKSACYVVLDTSAATDDEIVRYAQIISRYGNAKTPTKIADDKRFKDVLGKNAGRKDLLSRSESRQSVCYACSVKVDADGEIDWSSVDKSTIHPDGFTDGDVSHDFAKMNENRDIARDVVKMMEERSAAAEKQRIQDRHNRIMAAADIYNSGHDGNDGEQFGG